MEKKIKDAQFNAISNTGLTIKALSQELNISENTIRNWKYGKIHIPHNVYGILIKLQQEHDRIFRMFRSGK